MTWGIDLPDGTTIRGRGLREPAPAGPEPEFGLYLARPKGWEPSWPAVWVDWPDFRTPRDGPAAAAAIVDAYERARAGLRVEVALRRGRRPHRHGDRLHGRAGRAPARRRGGVDAHPLPEPGGGDALAAQLGAPVRRPGDTMLIVRHETACSAADTCRTISSGMRAWPR